MTSEVASNKEEQDKNTQEERSKKRVIIDIGNTKAKYAIFEGTEMEGSVCVVTHEKMVDEILAMCEKECVKEGMVASVSSCGDTVTEQLIRGGLDMRTFNVRCPLPMPIDYTTPETLGVDRIAAVVGAIAKYGKGEMLIIDAGTAITYDYVGADGHYKGGCISPGIEMRFKALNAYTGKLPLCDKDDYRNDIGDSTRSAIASGVINGVKHEVMGYINAFSVKKDKIKKIIVTGGDYKYLVLPMKSPTFVAQNLVLEGVAYVAEQMSWKKTHTGMS